MHHGRLHRRCRPTTRYRYPHRYPRRWHQRLMRRRMSLLLILTAPRTLQQMSAMKWGQYREYAEQGNSDG